MAELKIAQFCSLATSPSWHTWLYNYDRAIYDHFMISLKESKGCTYNRELMTLTLDKVKKSGGYELLIDFINVHFPYMVVGDGLSKRASSREDVIFPEYVANVLTYPRRIIFEGEPDQLNIRIQRFTHDKIKHDSIIIGNKGYVEYLSGQDSKIADKIPLNNWLIASYRKNNI